MSDLEAEGGSLSIEKITPSCVKIFYSPEEEKILRARQKNDDVVSAPIEILLIDGQDKFLTIYPTKTNPDYEGFLKPKYNKIHAITLSGLDFQVPSDEDEVWDVLYSLPTGFVQDFNYGLGLRKEYRFIVDAVEEISTCNEIFIAKEVTTGIDQGTPFRFNIEYREFEKIRKYLNRITSRAQIAARSVKEVEVYNIFAQNLDKELKPIQVEKSLLSQLLAQASSGGKMLDESTQEIVLETLLKNKREIAEAKPEKLAKLQNEIELVTLERLIGRFEKMLDQKLQESRWQRFFNENPFILSMAFGYPIIKVKDQASIGGKKLSGSGEKITDFLVKNSLTNNTALFEIKTPQTQLLGKSTYRDGVFAPTTDLAGSINQTLDQRYQFQKQIAQIKETSRIHDMESYAIHSCLIVGRMPVDVDRHKSFELFRRNSKEVQIVTFDELLEKLKQLHNFLIAGETNRADTASL